jgi:hypothetical protein
MGSVSPVWFSRDTPGVHLSDSSPAAAGEGLGKAVSLSADGTTALVGAWGYGGNYTGAVYVFHETPAGWSQSAVLTNGAGAADDRFGAAVALSPDGTTALIGAWGVDSYRRSRLRPYDLGRCLGIDFDADGDTHQQRWVGRRQSRVVAGFLGRRHNRDRRLPWGLCERWPGRGRRCVHL